MESLLSKLELLPGLEKGEDSVLLGAGLQCVNMRIDGAGQEVCWMGVFQEDALASGGAVLEEGR
jgi:hypothetical protein